MKFEQIYTLYTNFFFNLSFHLFFLIKIVNKLLIEFFFIYKVSNFADSFWYFYSNKKFMYELRYLSK